MYLSKSDFSQLIKNAPLVAVDLCILKGSKILIGKRNNSPAKGFFFVPGGRIRKSETIENAQKRILKNELGITLCKENKNPPKNIGIFEHFYSDDSSNSNQYSTHYIVLAYLVHYEIISKIETISLKDDHSELIWQDLYDLNSNCPKIKIHPYAINYIEYIKKNLD